jgi:hypothetical protein
VAELGDITRFSNPRQPMAYIGLVPSEHSSGRSRRQGGITKAGNAAARRMLIEAAWSYRFPARISRHQLLQQERLAKTIRDIGWKAQERLCRRHRKLIRAGKPKNVVSAAIARELTGFVAPRSRLPSRRNHLDRPQLHCSRHSPSEAIDTTSNGRRRVPQRARLSAAVRSANRIPCRWHLLLNSRPA